MFCTLLLQKDFIILYAYCKFNFYFAVRRIKNWRNKIAVILLAFMSRGLYSTPNSMGGCSDESFRGVFLAGFNNLWKKNWKEAMT